MGREGVAQRMAGRWLDDPRRPHRRAEGTLDPSLVKVMTAPLSRTRVLRKGGCRKYVLPPPFSRGSGILPVQGIGEVDSPAPFSQTRLVEPLHLLEMRRELRFERRRQHGHPVFRPLAVPHRDLIVGEVDVLDPQAERLGQAHPRPIEQGEEEAVVSLKPRKRAPDLFRCQHHRRSARWLLLRLLAGLERQGSPCLPATSRHLAPTPARNAATKRPAGKNSDTTVQPHPTTVAR